MFAAIRFFVFVTPLLALCTAHVDAQERTAAGALDTQMTWSTLKNLVDAASTKVDGVNSRVDQIVKCNKKKMSYAPDANGADGDGCIDPLADISACAKNGQLYNPTTNACVKAAGGTPTVQVFDAWSLAVAGQSLIPGNWSTCTASTLSTDALCIVHPASVSSVTNPYTMCSDSNGRSKECPASYNLRAASFSAATSWRIVATSKGSGGCFVTCTRFD